MGAGDLVDNITTRVKNYFEQSQILSSLRASYRKFMGQREPTSASEIKDTLTDMIIDMGDQLRTEQKQLRRALNKRRGRGLLAWSESTQKEVNTWSFQILKGMGYYGGESGDDDPENGGCLPMSTIIARARAFSQLFFPDTSVDTTMEPSLDFCLPDFSRLDEFGEDNFGIKVEGDEGVDGWIKVPIHTWDGSMSRSRNVFQADRLDGSAFVGSADVLKPPAIDKAAKIVPVVGTTCSGASFMQIGDKIGFGGMARGMKSIIEFLLEQVASMQVCRAKARDKTFIMSRRTLMSFFGLWTPMWAIDVATEPPVGQELNFDMFANKVRHRMYVVCYWP